MANLDVRIKYALAKLAASRADLAPMPEPLPSEDEIRAALGPPFDIPRTENPDAQSAFAEAIEAAKAEDLDRLEELATVPWQLPPPRTKEFAIGANEIRGLIKKRMTEGAVRDLRVAYQVTDRLLQAEGYFIHSLVGCSMTTLTNRRARSLATTLKDQVVNRELLSLPLSIRADEWIMTVIFSEIRNLLPYSLSTEYTLWEPVDTSHIIPWQTRELFEKWFVSKHPNPYDPIATARLIGDLFRPVISEANTDDILRTGFKGIVGYLPHSLFDIPVHAYNVEFTDFPRIRRQLKEWPNPYGRLAVATLLSMSRKVHEALCRAEVDTAATQIVLAAAVHGRTPATLAELVDASLLDQIPTDPFTKKPLEYANGTLRSPARGRPMTWRIGS